MDHTPGPWKLQPQEDADEFWFRNGYWPIRIGPGRGYCVPVGINPEVEPDQREADARLIAAAPELLKALRTLARWQIDRRGGGVGEMCDFAEDAIRATEPPLTCWCEENYQGPDLCPTCRRAANPGRREE